MKCLCVLLLAVVGSAYCALDQAKLVGLFRQSDINPADGCITQTELEAVFDKFDANSNTFVEHDEFTASWGRLTGFSAAQSGALYNMLDYNQDNKVNALDLVTLFANFDANVDGCVNVTEFVDKWTQVLPGLNGQILP